MFTLNRIVALSPTRHCVRVRGINGIARNLSLILHCCSLNLLAVNLHVLGDDLA